ncbi:unnamed protein product [Somion occarium]|uniref:Uncharacterized protein n=1 Tax=Somion occarium TaxID=3059160 RepID=A0ABP1EAD3_9APHY
MNLAELLLVPNTSWTEYVTTTPKKYPWKHFPIEASDSPDPLEKAKAAFHLLNPQPSRHWQTCLEQRHFADALRDGLRLADFPSQDIDRMNIQIRMSIKSVITSTALSQDEKKILADGVVPMKFYMTDDDITIRDATIFTRVHSPIKPVSVDVFWLWHHRMRLNDVEWYCSLMYRVLDPLTASNSRLNDTHSKPRLGQKGTY